MRGIMFIELLYEKTLKKLKTQTRRNGGLDKVNGSPDKWRKAYTRVLDDGRLGVAFHSEVEEGSVLSESCFSVYKSGEVLYLKEPYYVFPLSGHTVYRFDRDGFTDLDWENKMFMPAHIARAYIRITGIKCERLFDISDEDCIKEGVETSGIVDDKSFWDYQLKGWYLKTPQQSYFSLFLFANKYPKKKPIKNEWVWVYDFVLCDKDGKEL